MYSEIEQIERMLGIWLPHLEWVPHDIFINFLVATYQGKYNLSVRFLEHRFSRGNIYEWRVDGLNNKTVYATGKAPDISKAQRLATVTLAKLISNDESGD